MTGQPRAPKHILFITYSQSGEVARVAETFAGALEAAGAGITWARLRPRRDYPFPWKSLRRFFGAMPETVLGQPPQIDPPAFDPAARFDLVVIAYPVWFLSPAPPVQAFFETAAAAVLKNASVLTISVSRSMWHNASETMKRLLSSAGAYHRDNIVVTHRGPPLATFVSTPRALLSGSRDSFLGVFPQAGVSEQDLVRVRHLGGVVARRLPAIADSREALLRGEPAVAVKKWSVVPELLAWYCFRGWAIVIRALGKVHGWLRIAGVYAFAAFLVCLILLGLPLTVLAVWTLRPLIRHRLDGYIDRLGEPSGLLPPDAKGVDAGAATSTRAEDRP